MTNLSHSAPFHSNEKITPSNPGIKQLGFITCVESHKRLRYIKRFIVFNRIPLNETLRNLSLLSRHRKFLFLSFDSNILDMLAKFQSSVFPLTPSWPYPEIIRSLASPITPLARGEAVRDAGVLSGNVEVDGTYFGGYVKPANEKKDRKDRRKKVHQSGKRQSVIVMRERGIAPS